MIDQMGAGPSDTMENGGSEWERGSAGLVARASYNYKKKYYIEGSLRHDGSDLFPKDRRWVISFPVLQPGLCRKKVFFNR